MLVPNGRAVVVVFVFERLEAVGMISSFRHGASKAAGSEAWRGFCHHGITLCGSA